MSTTADSPNLPAGPGHLNGWKEISAYLGRSVRTAQRWEKEFGLPVRRFGLSKPESVFALPRELDAWLETAQGLNARSGAGASEAAGGPPETARRNGIGEDPKPQPFFLHAPVKAAGVVILVAAVAVIGIWALWHASQTAPPPVSAAPAEWRIDLDALVVLDAEGNALWRHTFPRELDADAYKEARHSPRSAAGGIADVDGDGSREVWFIAKTGGGPIGTALYLFEHDGRVRWTYQPRFDVRFGADTFGPSWLVDRAFITPDPAAGPGRGMWVVLYDAALFPSLLQRLDPRTGKSLSAFWSNGYVLHVALDLTENRRRLFVGSCNNEHKAGSLAVLDPMNPNGSAPAELAKYRCTSCPPGEPEAFLVFPKPARFGPSDHVGAVDRVSLQADGSVTIGVHHALVGAAGSAAAIYTLDAELNPRSADAADDYLNAYRLLVSQGAAPAGAPDAIDPDREFMPILRWDRAARRFVEVSRRR